MKWSGSRDLHPDRSLHGRRCCCYTTILSETGAPGRTRTDVYEFTKLVLWLLRHRGFDNGVHGTTRTCDLHLRMVAL